MQFVPRPVASVPLGGSLRASRAALLTRPRGPLAAVDLADGRALIVEDLGAGWTPCASAEPAPRVPEEVTAVISAPVRRRRLATALALAVVLGASVVGLATGFSGSPSPAVARPLARPAAGRPPLPAMAALGTRGGRAAVIVQATVRPHPTPVAPPPPEAAVAAPRAPPAQPRLPELPSVPAL